MTFGEPFPAYDKAGLPITAEEWGKLRHDEDGGLSAYARIGETNIADGLVWVSTVWLGIDHGFGRTSAPLIFETMIFGGRYDECQWRYATRAEAEAGHERVVEALRAGEAP